MTFVCSCNIAGATRIAAVLLLVLGSDPGAADAPQQHEVWIAARQVADPPGGRLVLRHGAAVVIRWLSDEAVKLHVHGYDLEVDLQPGVPASTAFTARATGRFPVTSHGFGAAARGVDRHRALLYIEVHPR